MRRLSLMLAGSVLFVLASLVALPRQPRLALAGIVFFGAAGLLFFFQLRQRRELDAPGVLALPLGEWVNASQLQPRLAASFFIAIGAGPFLFPELFDDDPAMRWLTIGGGVLGVLVLVASLLGLQRGSAIRRTREGFELRGELACLIHFDNIGSVGEREFGGQVALLVVPVDLERLMRTVPVERRAKMERAFRTSESLVGAPLLIQPARFGLHAGALRDALLNGKR